MPILAAVDEVGGFDDLPPYEPSLAGWIVVFSVVCLVLTLIGGLFYLWSEQRKNSEARRPWLPAVIGIPGLAVVAVGVLLLVLDAYRSEVARFEALPRLETAGSAGAGDSTLLRLAGDSLSEVRLAVAANPSAPSAALTQLAIDGSGQIRSAVADNPAVPPEALLHLAQDRDPETRATVAANPSTPAEALWALAADHDTTVRMCVGTNSSAPTALLEQLAGDPDPRVRLAVIRNPASTKALLDIAGA